MARPEILAPAGDMTCLQTALDAGADAVYLGLGELNMRTGAAPNFTRETLPDASARCRARGVKLYLTLNSILFEGELGHVGELLRFVKPYVDAVLVADFAAIEMCRELGVPFHISTQMSCSNSQAAEFFRGLGASRVVLARECTLEEVAAIVKAAGIPVETFVHGAVCVAVSGRCLLSHTAYGCSSNRGECLQPCRREYLIKEVREGKGADAEFVVTPHTVLSAKDLCSLPFVDRLMAAGIASFKIEGRARNADYVKATVSAYREAVDAVLAGAYTPELVRRLVARCDRVYHRDFGFGLYYGRPGREQLTDKHANQSGLLKENCGVVMDYFAKARVAQVQVVDHVLSVGDGISIQGESTGVVDMRVTELWRDSERLQTVGRGEWATFPCPRRVHRRDRVFKVVPSARQEGAQA
jgi:putative protease